MNTVNAITITQHKVAFPDTNDVLDFHYIVHPETHKLWFTGVNIARCLKYTHPPNAIAKYVPEVHKISWSNLIEGFDIANMPENWQNNCIMIDEIGLNYLIMKSTLPKAELYKNWICEEVLPSISSTGTYTLSENNTKAIRKPRALNYKTKYERQLMENQNQSLQLQVQKLEHEKEMLKYETNLMKVQYEKQVAMSYALHQKKLTEKFKYTSIAQKSLLDHNMDVHAKTVDKLEIAKGRVVPDMNRKCPQKATYVALYRLDRYDDVTFSEENRPIHFITRS